MPPLRARAGVRAPSSRSWQCKACGHQTSVTAGTVLHRSRTSLREWFWAAYLVTTHTPGMSALHLQRQLGIPRYETAWTLLRNYAAPASTVESTRRTSAIRKDSAGGASWATGPWWSGPLKSGAVSGRVRLQVVPDASGSSLTGFVHTNVELGTIVITDGWQGYAPLSRMGYPRHPTTQGRPARAAVILPRVHRVFSNLKTWLRGPHPGVDPKHLQAYLDEFTFRFTRRRTPMAAFQSLLGLTGAHGPTTYKMLYASEPTG